MKALIDILAALLSPIIAITITYIAYQQWKINVAKEKRESSADKLRIYLVVKKFLQSVDDKRVVDPQLYADLQEPIALADFLFDSEVQDWLLDIDIDASSWLESMRIIDSGAENAPKNWVNEEFARNEKIIDRLQQAHCDLLRVFENKVIK